MEETTMTLEPVRLRLAANGDVWPDGQNDNTPGGNTVGHWRKTGAQYTLVITDYRYGNFEAHGKRSYVVEQAGLYLAERRAAREAKRNRDHRIKQWAKRYDLHLFSGSDVTMPGEYVGFEVHSTGDPYTDGAAGRIVLPLTLKKDTRPASEGGFYSHRAEGDYDLRWLAFANGQPVTYEWHGETHVHFATPEQAAAAVMKQYAETWIDAEVGEVSA
jgi:hypothetical protein